MVSITAKTYSNSVVKQIEGNINCYPLLRCDDDNIVMYSVSPLHGRSFVVGQHLNRRYIVTKGNGLCYSQHPFLYTPEMPTDVWGLLLMEDALRDYYCCQDVQTLGINTNQMECVMELDYPLYIEKTGATIKPAILQYNVECPYRINDAPFMERSQIEQEVAKWQQYNRKGYTLNHMIAAEVLISNLRTMHDHEVLHNAIHEQNYTWALELLDFEACRTPQHPYTEKDSERYASSLYSREVIQTYVVINYIAGVLGEKPNYKMLDGLFKDYGFDIEKLSPTKL